MGNTGIIIPNVYLTPNQTIDKNGTYSIYDASGDPGLEIEEVNLRKRKRDNSNVFSIGHFTVDIDIIVLKGIRVYNPTLQDYEIIPFTDFSKTTQLELVNIPEGKVLVSFFQKGLEELTVSSFANYDTGSKGKTLGANAYYTLIDRCSDGEWDLTTIELVSLKELRYVMWNYRVGDFSNTVYTHTFSFNPLLLECRGLYED